MMDEFRIVVEFVAPLKLVLISPVTVVDPSTVTAADEFTHFVESNPTGAAKFAPVDPRNLIP
jgi:hypothetical protein